MTINAYLTSLASNAIIRDSEKASIQTSISTLQTRLNTYFGKQLSDHFIFGSYRRGTILPRGIDEHSDIDYMVVFSDGDYKPQTYLDKLKRFTDYYYPSSSIRQSNPTIILSLNHIHFELVPAIKDDWYEQLQIPAKASSFNTWIETDPNNFNSELTNTNQNNNNLIKPLIRLVKYWNAQNGYPFESYSLEQKIVNHGFNVFGLLTTKNLWQYFSEFMEELELPWGAATWKAEKLNRVKALISEARLAESLGHIESSKIKIKQLIPPLGQQGNSGLLGRSY